jgi:hypothetical protein
MTDIKVRALNANGVSKESLIQLGSDPDLGHFQVICHWKDGRSTVGWSTEISHDELVFGSELLKFAVNERVFGAPYE